MNVGGSAWERGLCMSVKLNRYSYYRKHGADYRETNRSVVRKSGKMRAVAEPESKLSSASASTPMEAC